MNPIQLLGVALVVPCAFGVTLNLREALDLADQGHPQLRASEAQIDAARAGVTIARAYPNPDISFLGGRQRARVEGAVPGASTVYGFAQPLELGALRPSRIQLAQRGQDSSQFALEEIRLAVLSGVRRSFFQVLRRQGEIRVATDNLRLVEELRRRIQTRVDVGEAGRLELLRAEAEVVSARTLANSVQLQLVTALAQVRAAVGATLDADLEISGTLDPPVTLPPIETLRQRALDQHPGLQLARAEVQRARSRLSYENALKRPQPFLVSEIDQAPDNPTYRVGIAIPLPVWNRRQGQIAEASAAVRGIDSLLQARQIEILSALEGAYGRYGVASQQIAAFEQGLIQEAEAALQASEAAYQLGERGILEVLDAQRVLRGVRLDFLNAQFDRQMALVDLDQLRGVDLRRTTP
jgi:cobalt-zinc-cadmium efflux system outer membrane protein